MKRTAFRTFLLVSTIIVVAPACLAQSDNFDDNNDAGWTRYDPLGTVGLGAQGRWSFSNGTYRIQASRNPLIPASAGPARAGSYRTNDYTDFYMCADIVNWDESMDQAIGFLARMTQLGLGTTDGYALTYQVPGHDIDITRFTDEGAVELTSIPLSPSDDITMVPGRSYRYVWIGKGNEFTVRIYELPNLETPILEARANDGVYTNGVCGFLVYDNSGSDAAGVADTTFDNYFATKSEPISPPPLFIDRTIVDGTVVLSWSTNLTGFVLQAAPNLLTPSSAWTDLVDPIFVNEQTGRYEYIEFTDSAQRFFRLRRPPD
jgi:hypothetical protein